MTGIAAKDAITMRKNTRHVAFYVDAFGIVFCGRFSSYDFSIRNQSVHIFIKGRVVIKGICISSQVDVIIGCSSCCPACISWWLFSITKVVICGCVICCDVSIRSQNIHIFRVAINGTMISPVKLIRSWFSLAGLLFV